MDKTSWTYSTNYKKKQLVKLQGQYPVHLNLSYGLMMVSLCLYTDLAANSCMVITIIFSLSESSIWFGGIIQINQLPSSLVPCE